MTEQAFQDVPVDKVMTHKPAVVEPESTLSEAAEALLQGGFRHLPVVNGQGRPVGMISERDLRARLGTDLYGFTRATVEALSEPVSGVMTPDPISVKTGTRIGAVLDGFADERVGALLVVDEADRLAGILSYVDLLLWLRDHPHGGPGGEALPGGRAGMPEPRRAAKRKPARKAVRRAARGPARKARKRSAKGRGRRR
jgi:acetoin utilization protein AcuB